MAILNKIDSNVTGLRYAEEISLKTLNESAADIWIPLEPNSYADFGGSITTIARNPINPSRQRKKGVVTDLDASGGFNSDVTQTNLQDILQGFFFADLQPKVEFGGASEITGVTTGPETYTAASGLDAYAVGDLVFATGFTNTENNGLKTVTVATATVLTVAETLVAETPGATAKLVQVGFETAAGDLDVDITGDFATLTTTTKDLTELGLSPGEWIFIGGDTGGAAGNQFLTPANNGFKRIKSITTNAIIIDKSTLAMATEANTAELVHIYIGRLLKNQLGTSIVRRSYSLERELGAPDDANPTHKQYEYIDGAIPNELTLNIQTADKLTADLTFVGLDNVQIAHAAPGNERTGTRPALVESDAFNTSSDFSRIKMGVVSTTDETVTALFAFVTDLTITLTNNVSPNKAVGVLGAFEATAGTFQIGGSMEAYFSTVSAIESVRNNADITFDVVIAKANAGIAIDIPLITLGDGRPNVEQDQAIKLPLTMDAATGAKIDPNTDHTLLLNFFDYLPTAAE